MQRIRQLVFDSASDTLPMLGIDQPVRTVGAKRPGADGCDAVRERIDIPFDAVCLFDLACEPIRWDRSFPHQKAIERGSELRMSSWRDFAIIGHLADVPQSLDRLARLRERADLVVAR